MDDATRRIDRRALLLGAGATAMVAGAASAAREPLHTPPGGGEPPPAWMTMGYTVSSTWTFSEATVRSSSPFIAGGVNRRKG